MQEPSNFFDDLLNKVDHEQAIKDENDRRQSGQLIDQLIHKLFKQDEDGQELLELWTNALIMQPTADDGMDMVAIGIREGQKRMIRGIILSIRRVEEGNQ